MRLMTDTRQQLYNGRMKRLAPLGLLLGAALLLCGADKSATLNFLVVKAENGKPIRNASVVLHPVRKDGSQSHGGYQLKTDPEGKASFAGAPYGKIRVQVLIRGFQTYGEDYQVHEPSMDITIKLKRPAKQYSIYEDHPTANDPKKDDAPKKPE